MATFTQAIQKLYVAYFNRPADVAGLAYWETVVAAQSGSTALVSAAFAGSNEYKVAYQGFSNSQIVDQVYLNLFGRRAEASGLAFWANALDHHLITIDNVVTQIATGAQGTDLTAYNLKVDLATSFTAQLPYYRTPDVYSGANAIQVAKTFIALVNDQASANDAYLHLNSGKLFNEMVQAQTGGLVSPEVIALTSASDQVGLSKSLNGDDFFTATAATLNASDSIDGGPGSDTLQVRVVGGGDYTLANPALVKSIETVSITADHKVVADVTRWQDLRNLNLIENGGANITAGSNVSVKVAGPLGAGSILVRGGSSVLLETNNLTTGAISVLADKSSQGSVGVTTHLDGKGQAGDITINGGAHISVTQLQNAGATTIPGVVNITGSELTQSVTVANQIYGPSTSHYSAVTIRDASMAGSIENIAVSGFTSLDILAPALRSLSLAAVHGDTTVDLGAQARDELTLAADLTRASVTLNGMVDTLNLVGRIDQSSNIINPFVTTLNVTGSSNLAFGLSGLSALRAITLSGQAGFHNDLSQLLHLETVDSSDGGQLISTINAMRTSFSGGEYDDVITVTADGVAKNINLGAGEDSLILKGGSLAPGALLDGGGGTDTLHLPFSMANILSNNLSQIVNFDVLEFDNADGLGANQTLDMAALAHFSGFEFAGGNGLTLNYWDSTKTLYLVGEGISYAIQNPAFVAGTHDVLQLALTADDEHFTGSAVNFASSGIAVPNVETVRLNLNGLSDLPAATTHALTLNSNAATDVRIDGYGNLALNLTDAALTSLDATMLHGNLSLVLSGLSGAATILGSFYSDTHATIDVRAANHGITYKTFGNNAGAADTSFIVGTGSNMLGNFGKLTFTNTASSLSEFTTINWPGNSFSLEFVDAGLETFATTGVKLGANASLSDYANAAIHQGGDARSNGAFSWFSWNGDSYLVESHHDGRATDASFIDGTDLLVKFIGQIDLGKSATPGNLSAGASLVFS